MTTSGVPHKLPVYPYDRRMAGTLPLIEEFAKARGRSCCEATRRDAYEVAVESEPEAYGPY
jgi:hypothetical protein